MEPRPQRPSRATGPYISTGTPSPNTGGTGNFGSVPYDASSAPPAPPPAIGYDPDYSPGQPLTPLRGPRGANIVGPLLAVAALAIIVAAVAFIVSQFRGDGGGENPPATLVAATDGTPDDEDDEVAGEDGDPTDESSGNEDDPTEEAGNPDDEENAEATNTPRVNRTTESEDPAAGGPDEEEPEDEESGEKTRARQWLPTEAEIGEGFTQTENGSRGQDEVVASFPEDQVEAVTAQLDESGWQENVFRTFTSETAADGDVYVVSISVHRFDSEQGAKDALAVFAEGGRVGSGLTEVDTDRLGEGSVVLQGQIDGGNMYVIYVREGDFIFRIAGLSRTGDPAEYTTEITNQIIEP